MLTDPFGAERAWQRNFGDMQVAHRDAVAIAQRNANQRDEALRRLAEMEKKLAQVELALSVEVANSGGLLAQLNAFKKEHSNSPLLQDSGKRFKDGDVKTRGRLIFESEFDRILESRRISNPSKYRVD